jgi:hypothetical protein
MADVVNFTEFRAGQQPVKDNEEGCRSDDAYIEAMFNSARAQLTDTMEIDLGHITQENDSITIEDMIRCQIAGLTKFLRDYPHQLYPAKGWDRGRRRTKIGNAPEYESRVRLLEEENRHLRRLVNHYKSAYETATAVLAENERTGLTRREQIDYLMRGETPPDRKEG